MPVKKIITNVVLYFLLSLSFLIFVFPFFLLIVNSFKMNGEIISNPFAFPTKFDYGQFMSVIETMNFAVTFKNTFIITFTSVSFTLLFSSMCAHYLVRNATKLDNTFFMIMVASMIIPFQSIMIPLMYIYGAKFHLIDMAPVMLLITLYIGFGSSIAVFMYHGFLKNIPLELEEAAFMDGCTRIQTFFRIVLPMLTPITMTIGILNVLAIWNDFLLPSLILYKEEDLTMPLKMIAFNGEYLNNYELLIPAMLMTILPILVGYLFGQRFIIKGVMQGAIK